VRKSQAQADHFAPYKTNVAIAERVALILLLTLAAFLRLYRLPEVPPGIHDDEIINAQIADQLLAGAPFSVFYEAGEGREGLYHPLLVASRMLTARVPYWYRLPSVVCSLLTILLVHRLSRRWFGPWTALVAAGGLAVAFWPVHLGRETLRVVTLPPLAAGMSLALWRGLEQRACGRHALSWFVLAGLLLGLTQYTYLAAHILPLLALLFAAYLACFHRTRLRSHWPGLVLLLAVGALVAAPLAVYIGTHWRQQERITRLGEPLQALLNGNPHPALSSSAATLGMFVWRGDPQPHYNLPGRPVFEPIGSILFLVGLLIALRNLRHPASAFCLLWTATTLVPGMLTQPAPHFVRTAGALVTAFVFPGLTVRWLVRRTGSKWQTVLAAALGLILVLNAGLTFRDYFHRWPDLDDVRAFHHAGLAEVARYLDRTPETAPIAACTPFLNEQHFFWRTDRQALPYLLNRRDLDIGWYSCLEAQLFPRDGRTSLYLFGDDWGFAPFVPPEWVEQGQTVTTLRGERLVRLEVADRLEMWLAQLTRPTEHSPSFGDTMRFLGYRQEPVAPLPGDTLEILTAWQVLTAPRNDLAIFLHLLDSDGKLVGQGDALTALSDTLRPEDVFVQRHTITLAEDLRPGEYRLVAGLYVREGTRLSLGSGAGDALILDTVEIRDGRD
jgi:hypothetical protein